MVNGEWSINSPLAQYYKAANMENQKKMLGLIFPEKLVFSNHTFQTKEPSEVLGLLCSAGNGLEGNKKGLSIKRNEKSCVVTPSGFKPETF